VVGFFSRLKTGHHYTSIAVKASLERDEAAKKLIEARGILATFETGPPETDDPRLTEIYTAAKRTMASYKNTCTAYEAAVRACQAVGDQVDAACKNADFEPVDTAWVTATRAVFLAKAAATETVSTHAELTRAMKAFAAKLTPQ
jgi:hypothetical protein